MHKAPKDDTTIFVGDLSALCDENIIEEIFRSHGFDPINIRLMRGKQSLATLSYGFVQFKSRQEAETAITMLDSKMFHGRKWRVKWAGANIKSTKAVVSQNSVHVKFIAKLPDITVTEETLRKVFSQFGAVLDASIKVSNVTRGPGECDSGYGFVHFSEKDDGIAAAFDSIASTKNFPIYFGVAYSCDPSQHLLRSVHQSNLLMRRTRKSFEVALIGPNQTYGNCAGIIGDDRSTSPAGSVVPIHFRSNLYSVREDAHSTSNENNRSDRLYTYPSINNNNSRFNVDISRQSDRCANTPGCQDNLYSRLSQSSGNTLNQWHQGDDGNSSGVALDYCQERESPAMPTNFMSGNLYLNRQLISQDQYEGYVFPVPSHEQMQELGTRLHESNHPLQVQRTSAGFCARTVPGSGHANTHETSLGGHFAPEHGQVCSQVASPERLFAPGLVQIYDQESSPMRQVTPSQPGYERATAHEPHNLNTVYQLPPHAIGNRSSQPSPAPLAGSLNRIAPPLTSPLDQTRPFPETCNFLPITPEIAIDSVLDRTRRSANDWIMDSAVSTTNSFEGSIDHHQSLIAHSQNCVGRSLRGKESLYFSGKKVNKRTQQNYSNKMIDNGLQDNVGKHLASPMTSSHSVHVDISSYLGSILGDDLKL